MIDYLRNNEISGWLSNRDLFSVLLHSIIYFISLVGERFTGILVESGAKVGQLIAMNIEGVVVNVQI